MFDKYFPIDCASLTHQTPKLFPSFFDVWVHLIPNNSNSFISYYSWQSATSCHARQHGYNWTQRRTSYNTTKHNIQGLAWAVGSYKPAPRWNVLMCFSLAMIHALIESLQLISNNTTILKEWNVSMQVESETQFIGQWCCAELDAALAHPHSSLVLVSSCMTVRILYFTIF